MRQTIWIFLPLAALTLTASGQPANCPVKAGFVAIPHQSIVNGAPVLSYEIKDNSSNATSVKYSINNSFFKPLSGEIHLIAGPNSVLQIATNGTCSDSFETVIFCPGVIPPSKANIGAFLYRKDAKLDPYSISGTADQQLILSAGEQYASQAYSNLVKMDRYGCVKKAVSSDEKTHWYGITSNNKGINLAAFSLGSNNPGYPRGILRLSDDLDPVWAKNFSAGTRSLVVERLTILPDGGFLSLNGYNSNQDLIADKLLIRHSADGSVIWARHFQFPGFGSTYSSGMVTIGNRIFLHLHPYVGSVTQSSGQEILVALDLDSGNILWQKSIGTPTHLFIPLDLATQNGKLILTGYWDDPADSPNAFVTLIQLDPDGNIERNVSLSSNAPTAIEKGFFFQFLDIDGQNAYLHITTGSYERFEHDDYFYDAVIRLRGDWSVDWSLYNWSWSSIYSIFGTVLPDGALATLGGGVDITPSGKNYNADLLYQAFDKNFNSNTPICALHPFDITVNRMPPLKEFAVPGITVSSETVRVSDVAVPIAPIDVMARYTDGHCNDYLDTCNMIKITGPESICKLDSAYRYTAWRCAGCSQSFTWEFPQNAKVLDQTGNTVTLQFDQLPQGSLKAFSAGVCTAIRDSIAMRYYAKPIGPLELGRDSSLCDDEYYNVSAKPGYQDYLWSTGDDTNSITINLPGKYWLDVKDLCTNYYSDTVVITRKPNGTIDAGADQEICPAAPTRFTAPQGFEDYLWRSDKGVLVTRLRSFSTASPGQYFLQARVPGGCLARDTVRLSLKPVPQLALSGDTTICAGDSIHLDAGAGFTAYAWNTGASSQKISVATAGRYSVQITAPNGCVWDSSCQVTMQPLPQPQLDRNPVICKGTFRVLDAGSEFTSYQWQDGSTASSYRISMPGSYWVTVTNGWGCKGSDTTQVLGVADPPAGFLGPDDTICINGSKWLAPATAFAAYQWSTGSDADRIEVKQSGLYWLTVTDQHGCTGSDSIVLSSVTCLLGIHFPNAFSPNGDGKNDLFKPQVFSAMGHYEFSIYNCFGQLVFSTRDPGRGWDGKFNGRLQDNDGFTWTCIYQVAGQPLHREKGIVVMVK